MKSVLGRFIRLELVPKSAHARTGVIHYIVKYKDPAMALARVIIKSDAVIRVVAINEYDIIKFLVDVLDEFS